MIKKRPSEPWANNGSNAMECKAVPTKWNDLKHKSSPEVRTNLQREARAEFDRVGFHKLRQARQQTQVAINVLNEFNRMMSNESNDGARHHWKPTVTLNSS